MAQATKTHPWRRYEPSTHCPWNLARAAHLHRRAGFGASWPQLQTSLKTGPQKTVDILLKPKADTEAFNKTCDGYVRSVDSSEKLRPWWLRRMVLTPHPLLEKMTLFWHDFFALSGSRGPGGAQMREHIAVLRRNAMGRFEKLIAVVAGDTATVLSLGSATGGITRLDESFALQLLGRYTVGPGNFSDEDVRQTVRAMTGWAVLRNRRRYFKAKHDAGVKTVLGKTGQFSHDDVVKIASEHPAAARNVVRKLYRQFISQAAEPAESLLAPLVRAFAKDFDISRLVETMLRSSLFFSDAVIGRRIKSPVEFAVGVVRSFEAMAPTARLAEDLADLGQNLYHPPTADGWAGGKHWINNTTLIGRRNLAAALLAESGPYAGKCDPAALVKRHRCADPEASARLLAGLLCGPGDTFKESLKLLPSSGPPPDRLRTFAYRLIARPEFQLA